MRPAGVDSEEGTSSQDSRVLGVNSWTPAAGILINVYTCVHVGRSTHVYTQADRTLKKQAEVTCFDMLSHVLSTTHQPFWTAENFYN